MGSRICSLKKRLGKTQLSDGTRIGGRGRLTDKVIDNLQVYYGKAIRNNTQSIEDMSNAVLEIWHHTRSTDKNPDHNLCPEEETSWCGYQRDLAKNTQEYLHSHPLPKAVSDSILPVLIDHSKSQLSMVVHNQNEAFNALIWQRATKETHSSLPTVKLATFLAVGIFNNEAKAIPDVLENLGIKPGCETKKCFKRIDHDRLRHSVRKSSDKQKKEKRSDKQKRGILTICLKRKVPV